MRVYIYLIALIVLFGCNKGLTIQEYIGFVQSEDNGLIERKTQGDFNFSLHYLPAELLALHANNSPKNIAENLKEYTQYTFFHFKISGSNQSNFLKHSLISTEDYYQRIAYFTTSAQSDFLLVSQKDTLSCQIYHFERNYGVHPYHTILLGFPKSSIIGDSLTVLFYDQLLSRDIVRLTIDQKDIKKIPNLKLDNEA